MAFRTTTLSITVIVTTALASACSGSGGQGSQNEGVNSNGGFGAGSSFGNGGSFADSAGGSSFGNGGFQSSGNGGFSPGGTNGAGGDGNGNGGGQNGAGGDGNGNGGDQNATGGDGNGNGGDQNATGGQGGGGTGPAPTADSASAQGTCTVANYSTGVAGGADYTTPVVYYPTNCDGPFPGVALIPGFTEVQSAVNQWGTFLASHGFVVISVDTAAGGVANTGVQPPSRALGLYEAVTTLKGENTRSGSPLAGKLNTSLMAVMGHSMGGGGTLLAANAHSDLKAAIGLCPWNPGVTYPQDTVPSLFFDGTADFLVPPTAAIAEYNSIPSSTPKVYAEFNGGTHYVANTPLGGAATDKVVARIGLSWLEVHEVGDSRYQQFIVKDTATMSNWMP